MRLSTILSKLRFRVSPFVTSSRLRRQKNSAESSTPENLSIKEGYVWKRTNLVPLNRSWKKRYFVLNEDELFFFKEKGEESVSGKIVRILDVVSLMAEDFGFRRKKFGLRLRAKNKESYILSCSSEADRNDWITAVLTAKSASLVGME